MLFSIKTGAALIVAALLFFSSSVLSLADGPPQPNNIKIPKISLDSPVVAVEPQVMTTAKGYRYNYWPVTDDKVNWHRRTSGNLVLTGHSDIKAQVFRDLWMLSIGDSIYVTNPDGTHKQYVVHKIVEVQEVGVSFSQRVENGKYIRAKADNRMTLVTCSRPGATHRLIIIAYLQ